MEYPPGVMRESPESPPVETAVWGRGLRTLEEVVRGRGRTLARAPADEVTGEEAATAAVWAQSGQHMSKAKPLWWCNMWL